MLIVYTGDGKGKSTAAFGLSLRAAGYGKKICFLQFVKEESWPEGARKAIRTNKSLSRLITIKALGSGFVKILGDTKPISAHKKSAHQALKIAASAITSGKYDLVVLDEILGALKGKLITSVNLKKLITVAKKKELDLVLTGRDAPKWLIGAADLVTEMKEVKHPFKKGVQAKKAIDF